jgi:hypothetical protein
MKNKELKKGEAVKIQLPNGKKFDLIFVGYATIQGLAWGKFKNEFGEVDLKPFSISSII